MRAKVPSHTVASVRALVLEVGDGTGWCFLSCVERPEFGATARGGLPREFAAPHTLKQRT
jgi:hypothetical protein